MKETIKKKVGGKEVTIFNWKDPTEENPHLCAESTKEILKKIENHFPSNHFIEKHKPIVLRFGYIPLSENSSRKNKQKYTESIHKGLQPAMDQGMKPYKKSLELNLEVIFFLTKDYGQRDIDNMLRPLLNALEGFVFEDDAQLKKIVAEKFLVKDIEKDIDKRIYEQIYCVFSIV